MRVCTFTAITLFFMSSVFLLRCVPFYLIHLYIILDGIPTVIAWCFMWLFLSPSAHSFHSKTRRAYNIWIIYLFLLASYIIFSHLSSHALYLAPSAMLSLHLFLLILALSGAKKLQQRAKEMLRYESLIDAMKIDHSVVHTHSPS